jgi:hypothetical protein
MSTTQKKGNHRNIYAMPTCWYLNFQTAGQVHREAFSFKRLGGRDRALTVAMSCRDLYDSHRQLITAAVEEIVAHPEREAKVLAAVRKTVAVLEQPFK